MKDNVCKPIPLINPIVLVYIKETVHVSVSTNEKVYKLMKLLYLINIHWLSVEFDWSKAGHAEGAILLHDHFTL